MESCALWFLRLLLGPNQGGEEDMEDPTDGRPPWHHLLPLLILGRIGVVFFGLRHDL
jgi:hypothetical protein